MNTLPEEWSHSLTYLGFSLERLIIEGDYYFVSKKLKKDSFSLAHQRAKEVSVKLIGFNEDLDSKDIFSHFDDLQVRAGTVEELLLFGLKFPKLQLKFPIAAFGSIANIPDLHGNLHVAYLGGDRIGRDLDLRHLEQIWPKRYRFLVVSKTS